MRVSIWMMVALGALGTLAILGVALASAPAQAASRRCAADRIQVSGYGCVAKSEVRKARRICAKLTPSDFRHCLCEDSKVVSACGD